MYGYCAGSRVPALFSIARIDQRLIKGIADASPAKHGRRIPGTDIGDHLARTAGRRRSRSSRTDASVSVRRGPANVSAIGRALVGRPRRAAQRAEQPRRREFASDTLAFAMAAAAGAGPGRGAAAARRRGAAGDFRSASGIRPRPRLRAGARSALSHGGNVAGQCDCVAPHPRLPPGRRDHRIGPRSALDRAGRPGPADPVGARRSSARRRRTAALLRARGIRPLGCTIGRPPSPTATTLRPV